MGVLRLEGRHAWMVGPARPPRTAADVLRALPELIGVISSGPAVVVVEGTGIEESLMEFLEGEAVEPGAETEAGTDDPRALVVHVPLNAETCGRVAWAVNLAGPDAGGQFLQIYLAGDEPELLVQWPGFPEEALLVAGRAEEEAVVAWAVPLKCGVERVRLG